MKLNQPAYAATGLVPGGRIAQQKACRDPRSIRATTYAKGLKDHPRHAEAVPTSSAPSVNFEILDMVEGDDWVAVRWQLTATYGGKSFQESIIAIYRFELCFGAVTVCSASTEPHSGSHRYLSHSNARPARAAAALMSLALTIALSPRRSVALAALSPSTWAMGYSFISAIDRSMRKMPRVRGPFLHLRAREAARRTGAR